VRESRQRIGVNSTASPKRSGPSGNRGLNALLAAAVWALIVPAAVDFSSLVGPDSTGPGGLAVSTADLSPSPVTRTLKISLIVIGLLVIATRVGRARALLMRINIFFVLFLLLMFTSILWSADSGATLARCVSYSTAVLVSFAFCLVGWHRNRFQNAVRPLLTLVLAGSLIYIILEPARALDFDGAGYHGLSGQKNPFGELCALGTLLWMHGWISGDAKGWKAMLGAALGWMCLWLSKSATSLLATVFASWFLVMVLRTSPALRRYTPYLVVLFASLMVAYALAVLNLIPGLDTILLGPITAITGKDMTFTNRTAIWEIIKEHVQLHPILGTGYGAYWTGAVPSSPSYVMLSRLYFWPSESHNGYLEVVNDLGFVGLTCLIAYIAVYVRQSLQLFRFDRAGGSLYLAIFFQQAITNLSESAWFSANGVLPVIIVTLATCALGRDLLEQQRMRALQASAGPTVALRRGAGSRTR
jgi:exopolysaccharide production protein ExoQ